MTCGLPQEFCRTQYPPTPHPYSIVVLQTSLARKEKPDANSEANL